MCRICVNERKAGVTVNTARHKFAKRGPRRTLEERIESFRQAEELRQKEADTKRRKKQYAERMKRMQVPAIYADPDIRRRRIVSIRHLMGMTQEEFSLKMGLTLAYIHRLERGAARCSMANVYLAERLLAEYQKEHKKSLDTPEPKPVD